MPAKQEVLSIMGLSTNPNEFGQLPPGSLKRAENCIIRRPGVLEPLPEAAVYTALGGTRQPSRLFSGDSKVLTVSLDTATGYNIDKAQFLPGGGSAGPTLTYGTTTRTCRFPIGKTRMTKTRNRWILTEQTSPLVFDTESTNARLAGLPAPAAIDAIGSVTTYPNVILHTTPYVKYTCVFFREVDSNYSFRSAPAPIIFASGDLVNDAAIQLVVSWSKVNTPIQAGDKIEIYRSGQGATTAEVDEEFALAKTYVITSTDVTNGFTPTILDDCQNNGLGQALYTNQFQEGAGNPNFMPPSATDVVTYRGVTFYTNRQAWANATLSVPTNFGLAVFFASNDATGVGVRSVHLTATLGSAVTTAAGAADVVGMVAGQQLYGTNAAIYFPANTKVLSVVGLTVTMDKNAIASTGGSVAFQTTDVLTVNGKDILVVEYGTMVPQMASANTGAIMYPSVEYFHTSGGFQNGSSFQIINPIPGETLTITGTNGNNYSPKLSALTIYKDDAKPNRVFFSRAQLPESVPPLYYFDVGAGSVQRLIPTESGLFAFCTDGLYRITGDGNDWRIDPINPDTQLIHPDAAATMDNNIYAWTNAGISLFENGAETPVSIPIQQRIRRLRSSVTTTSAGINITCDSTSKVVYVTTSPVDPTAPASNTTFVFHAETQQWTTLEQLRIPSDYKPIVASVFAPYLQTVVFAAWDSGTGATLYEYPLNTASFSGTTVEFNPLTGGEVGSLKQFMSVILNFATLPIESGASGIGMTFTPSFDNTASAFSTDLTSTETFVVPVPRRAALKKRLEAGFSTAPTNLLFGFYNLVGLSIRFRQASETVKR